MLCDILDQIICAVIVLVTVGILWAVYIIIPVFQIMVGHMDTPLHESLTC